ncbi:Uncharacterised protein [Candidatus Norongarragalina meridionalis]|nr:Uncharacterised protein [Candidatus Norongarragalina meridionalis]
MPGYDYDYGFEPYFLEYRGVKHGAVNAVRVLRFQRLVRKPHVLRELRRVAERGDAVHVGHPVRLQRVVNRLRLLHRHLRLFLLALARVPLIVRKRPARHQLLGSGDYAFDARVVRRHPHRGEKRRENRLFSGLHAEYQLCSRGDVALLRRRINGFAVLFGEVLNLDVLELAVRKELVLERERQVYFLHLSRPEERRVRRLVAPVGNLRGQHVVSFLVPVLHHAERRGNVLGLHERDERGVQRDIGVALHLESPGGRRGGRGDGRGARRAVRPFLVQAAHHRPCHDEKQKDFLHGNITDAQ